MCIPFYDYKVFELFDCGLIGEEKAEFLDELSLYADKYKNTKATNYELKSFLKEILPKTNGLYHIYASNGKHVKNYMLPYENYINVVCAFADNLKYTLFYNIVPFRSWCINVDVINSFESLYIDIDDLDIDVYSMDQKQIENFLVSSYGVDPKYFPSYVVCSGNGLHLYYKTNKFSDVDKREHYMKHLLNFYDGDWSCLSLSHQIRIPMSYNSKKSNQRKTKMYKLNNTIFNIEDFDCFVSDEASVQRSKEAWNKKIAEKRNATREQNKALKSLEISCDPLYKKNSNNTAPIEKTNVEFSNNLEEKNLYNDVMNDDLFCEYYYSFHKNENIKYISHQYYNENHKYRNLLNDLNNYYYRNGLHNNRDIFAFIYTVYAKKMSLTPNQCFNELSKYYDEDFVDELSQIIENVYKRNNNYNFKYETIAKWLNFSAEDIASSYCNFSVERKDQAKIERYKRNNKKRNAEARIQKEQDKLFVANNLSVSTKELYAKLNEKYSIRTIQRWKYEFAKG